MKINIELIIFFYLLIIGILAVCFTFLIVYSAINHYVFSSLIENLFYIIMIVLLVTFVVIGIICLIDWLKSLNANQQTEKVKI
jgi:hypothetical protein